ncbi:MAG: hypothetical protein RID81_07295 [Sandaracinaceae bacterium]
MEISKNNRAFLDRVVADMVEEGVDPYSIEPEEVAAAMKRRLERDREAMARADVRAEIVSEVYQRVTGIPVSEESRRETAELYRANGWGT